MESYIIYESGEIKSVSPLNGEDFSLKELQDAVKGYIEILPIRKRVGVFAFTSCNGEYIEIDLTKDYIIVMNSDGKFETPVCNNIATVLAASSCSIMHGDWIAGSVLICPNKLVR